MDTYGIIGYPLGHTCSPAYFNERFRREGMDAVYLKFEIKDAAGLPDLLAHTPGLRGFNVTIPHKENILPYLDAISEEARAIGAVNCVRVTRKNGRSFLTGYNTDMRGFRNALLRFAPAGIKKALILGDGGAAKAVRYALHTLGMETITASRHPQGKGRIGYPEVENLLPHCPLVINTTPLGTFPDTRECPPIPYGCLTPGHYLFDLVYNPETTEFMKRARTAGAHTCNGFAMWQGQAESAWDIWIVPGQAE